MDLKKYLPKQIRMAGKLITVKPISRKEALDMEVWGMYFPDDNLILVCHEVSPSNLLDTFLHELLHAVYHTWNMTDTDDEERTVHTTASALQALFLDNAHLLKCINRLTNEARKEHKL